MIDRIYINIKNSCSDCIWKATKMYGHTANCVRNMNSTYMNEDQRWLGIWNTISEVLLALGKKQWNFK